MRQAINEGVYITAWTFRNKKGLSTFPRRMEYRGRAYTFMDGLRYQVQKGDSTMQIFDMTDGHTNYRLACDAAQTSWTLVAITEHA